MTTEQGQEQNQSLQAEQTSEYVPTKDFQTRLTWFTQQFDRCDEIVIHEFNISNICRAVTIYLNGMSNTEELEQSFLEPLLAEKFYTREDISRYIFEKSRVPVSQNKTVVQGKDAVDAILTGQGLCFIEGDERLLLLPFTKYEMRSIEDAPNESVLRGPRESFVENIIVNVSLLRRRIKSNDFKTEGLTIGKYTQTKVILAYLDGVCKPSLVDEMKERLSYIKIDGILDSGYIEEMIVDNPGSPFTQIQYTERPDTVSASILEGRIAVIVDNTPIVLLAPTTFMMKMQSAEDYYQNYMFSTWIRFIRYIFLFISLLLPSFYIAITTFHPEMIPFRLLMSVSASREIVPFPALLEAFIMEICFEALREASIRIPKSIGQTVSIIGALIIGTAAVQAGIVSAAMVIIVSVTGIASFIIPSFELGLAFRLLRFPMMVLAGILGLFGIACGMIIIYVHLVNLNSFGVPYLSPITPSHKKSLKDFVTRFPWWRMYARPVIISQDDQNREGHNIRSWAKNKEDKE